jgi:hypothetical protein
VSLDGRNYPQYVPLYRNKSINFECLNKNKVVKKILYWNLFFGWPDFRYGLGKSKPFVKNNCPVTNCEVFNDKKRLNEADFVLVHMRNPFESIPINRPDKQRWIFFIYESPSHSGNMKPYNNLFNYTATDRIGAEFSGWHESNGNMFWQENKSFDPNADFYGAKDKMAAAVISHCKAISGRDDYIKELQSFVDVDVFGNCGKPCPNKYKDGKKGECKQIIGKEYKFYLSFENSYCKDYVTDKFFEILRSNIIPVVLGGVDHSFYVILHVFNKGRYRISIQIWLPEIFMMIIILFYHNAFSQHLFKHLRLSFQEP